MGQLKGGTTTPGVETVIKGKVDAKTIQAFGEGQVESMDNLVASESGFNPQAVNGSSGACGIGQALPCQKMGCSLTDIDCQAAWVVNYIKSRYGSPEVAWNFHLAHGYY